VIVPLSPQGQGEASDPTKQTYRMAFRLLSVRESVRARNLLEEEK
jgi:hypothetical protein